MQIIHRHLVIVEIVAFKIELIYLGLQATFLLGYYVIECHVESYIYI